MLLGDGRYDERGVKSDQFGAQGCKFRVSALDFEALSMCQLRGSPAAWLTYTAVDGVLDVVHTVLARARDQDELLGVLVQPLFHARIVPALLRRLWVCVVLVLLVVVDVAHVALRDILGRFLCGRRRLRGRRRGAVRHLVMSASDAGGCFRQ